MTKGVLYYNHGERCLARLAVSLHSLRKHYSGPVAIAAEGKPPEWFASIAKALDAQIIPAPASNEYGLVKKSRVWRVTPFDHTMFLDADTLVRAPVDQFFEWIGKYGCVQTSFNDWRTNGGKMRRRIEQWRKVDKQLTERAINYGKAINTGVQGWARGHSILPRYETLTAKGYATRGVSRKTLDEIAMQLLITAHKHHLAPPEWNVGCVHGDLSNARIVHYHGHKHCRPGPAGDLWKAEFTELLNAFPQFAEELKTTPDDSIALWLAEAEGYRPDMTIVTACNPAYADRLKRNLDLWQKTPGLMEQKFLVFVNGFRNARERAFLTRKNVRVIRWRYDGETPRETMLAAFVLGVAKHVTTPYWMKLDGDTEPLKAWEWPDYSDFTIVSHKWGYTKMKGGQFDEHWFTTLNRVFGGNIHPGLDPKRHFRFDHPRFASFAHIERTEFTRRIAKAIGDRVPIPSHDTLTWYCSELWGEKVKRMNMKEFFRP